MITGQAAGLLAGDFCHQLRQASQASHSGRAVTALSTLCSWHNSFQPQSGGWNDLGHGRAALLGGEPCSRIGCSLPLAKGRFLKVGDTGISEPFLMHIEKVMASVRGRYCRVNGIETR